MKQSLILVACFLPLAVIWLVMKLVVYGYHLASSEEQTYVREDAKRPHGPYLENPIWRR
jgi:hypothetical protein